MEVHQGMGAILIKNGYKNFRNCILLKCVCKMFNVCGQKNKVLPVVCCRCYDFIFDNLLFLQISFKIMC